MSDRSAYTTVLFDLDNTLFDFAASEEVAFADCATAAGLPAAAEVFARYKVINSALWAQVEDGSMSPSDAGRIRFERLLDEFGGHGELSPAELGELFQQRLGVHGELYPDAAALLDALVDKVKLALVTNGLTDVQRAKVARLDLERWFPVITISDEVGVAKPDPAIFDLTFDALEVQDRSRALMIGDSLGGDIGGAHAAGIASCWFNPAGLALPDGRTTPNHVITALEAVTGLVLGR
ncbi:MAG: YjjG family noncanonical pyrimidine nucleotidase [Actinomycetota bacterium]